ncbi:MAG: metal-dependent transcriptional regulator [Anaerolineales bacterium]|jgi:DtxR family Mn-dependent transcriptional regulator
MNVTKSVPIRKNLTHAVEDYLKTIYLIQSTQGRASTKDIADELQVKPASVTGMVQKLSETRPPLLEYRKHQGVTLTEQGEEVALEIIRHHRLLELFLTQILGYEWEDVHAEADRLEHVISEEFEERIAEALGDPSHDPHGDPIPTRDLQIPASSNTRLYDLRAGDAAVIERVQDRDPDLLRYLSEIGMLPQTHLTVLEYSPFDENLRLDVAGQPEPIVLGPRVTRQIFVCKV